MKIDSTEFSSTTLNSTAYWHDIPIGPGDEVVKRKKKLFKKYYGTSHIILREDADFIYEKGCTTLVLGAGQYGDVTLSREAVEFFKHHDCRVILQPYFDTIESYTKAKTIGLVHVTC